MAAGKYAVTNEPIRWIACVLLAWALTGCSGESELQPFSSDGCSLFPDTSLINEDDWCRCCFHHDIAYWRGGSVGDRETADRALEQCVLEATGDVVLARMMFEGVRFGGSPYFYNWYRWGYGWDYGRQYQVLTDEESVLADDYLRQYLAAEPESVCLEEE